MTLTDLPAPRQVHQLRLTISQRLGSVDGAAQLRGGVRKAFRLRPQPLHHSPHASRTSHYPTRTSTDFYHTRLKAG